MDALSDVLKSVRLEGAVYIDAEFSTPWCVLSRYGIARASRRLRDAGHVVFFHFLTEGECRVRLADGGGETHASAGDLLLFAHDDDHLLGSDLHLAPVESDSVAAADAAREGEIIRLRHGGGGAVTRFVCGYLACGRSVCRPLLDVLPRMLRIPIGDGPAATMLRELLKVGVDESAAARPGGESLLAKLSELMFVEAMRRYIEVLPPGGTGWLAGVRDAQVGRALALLHGNPGRDWNVEDLAREVALSRSAFADRFAALVCESPMQYLTRWRLAIAAQALRAGGEAIGRVAARSGYESEASFSRAFKREFGLPPAAWRRAEGRAPEVPA